MNQPAVLQLVDGFREGGSEAQAAQLSRLLHQGNRYRVHVAALNEGGPHRHRLEQLGLPINCYPLNNFYDRNALRQLTRFALYLRRHNVKIVHTHDFYSNVFGLAGAALARVPVRIGSRRETTGTRSAAQRRLERSAFRLAHAVVANAEAVRRALIAEGLPENKVVTVHNGLDLGRIASTSTRDEALRRLGLGETRCRFVTIVANFRLAVKDHATFLRAAKRVSVSIPGARFLIAGEGCLLGETRSLATSLGLDRSVYFLGGCGLIGDLLSVSDVCTLSSTGEGFSNAIIEYMGAGRPVVATDVGGVREAVQHGATGYLVAAGDDRSMARYIIELLTDPTHAQAMGCNARAVAEHRFSCDAQLRSTEALYERLL